MSIVSLDDLKDFLNITDDVNDDELLGKLDAAEAWVARYVGAPLPGTTATVTTYTDRHQRRVVLPVAGIGSIGTVTDPLGNTATLDPTWVNLAAGVVELPYHSRGAWTFTVTLPGEIGQDLREAVLIIAGHLWETQRGAAPVGPLATDDGTIVPGLGFAIPNRAVELLASYGLPGIA